VPRPRGDPHGDALLEIRRRVLHCPLSEKERPDVWAFLLRLPPLDAPRYLSLVRRGLCPSMDSLERDLSRTFNGNESFRRRVDLHAVVRVLNAAAWETGEAYVQGMNLFCGLLLYVLDELRGYYAFRRLCALLPTYRVSGLPGARAACQLVDRLIQSLDPELSAFLRAHNQNPLFWAHPFELSLGLSCRAFSEILAHWDVLLAFGFQLNPLINTARVILLRSAVMRSSQPQGVLSSETTPFSVRDCLSLIVAWLRAGSVPPALLADLRVYLTDQAVCDRYISQEPARRS